MESVETETEVRTSAKRRLIARSHERRMGDALSLTRKTAARILRDNNAAWVAGPGRICF
jgi:hypothetical protein